VRRVAGTRKGRDRLGRDLAKLWLAQAASNVGDGVYVTALPLLAATLTRDPLPVSAVVFAEWCRGCCSASWPGRCWTAGTGGG
jgi:hypothetical protein